MTSKNGSIVITGGAGGIGMACAKAFKEDSLIITDYSQEIVDKAVKALINEGYNAKGIACDITDKEDVKKLKNYVAENGAFKALVHAAGVSGTIGDAKKVFTINLVGSEYMVEAFYELAEQNSSAILFSSMMAHVVPKNENYDSALENPQFSGSFEIVNSFVKNSADTMYDFTKRGIQLLSYKHADAWGAKGARIVTISPGVIETKMGLKAAEEHPERMELIRKATSLGRSGTPEDVADVVKFLVSDAARFITATDVLVDGGVIQKIKKMS